MNNKRFYQKIIKVLPKIFAAVILFLILTIAVIYIKDILGRETPPENMLYLDLSLSENEFYISEETYIDKMSETILPYLDKYCYEGYFYTSDNDKIHYKTYILEKAKGMVAISHGYTESMNKYNELIYYFLKNNYSVFIMDHYGHGLSTHETDDESLVTIEDFTIYVENFKEFLDKIIIPANTYDLPILLFAHSMGGAIGTYLIEEYPEYFDAAVLSSPMFEINTIGLPDTIPKIISDIYRLIGKGKSYIWGFSPYDDTYNYKNSNSNSEARYKYYYNMRKENNYMHTSSGSFSWLSEAIEATWHITDKKNAQKVTIPILLFQAELDTLVKPYGQYRFAKAAANTTLIYVKGSKHEIFNADSSIAIPYYNTIFNFFDEICSE